LCKSSFSGILDQHWSLGGSGPAPDLSFPITLEIRILHILFFPVKIFRLFEKLEMRIRVKRVFSTILWRPDPDTYSIVNAFTDPGTGECGSGTVFIRWRHGTEYILLVASGQLDITAPGVLPTPSFTQNVPVQGKASTACTVLFNICTFPAKVHF
jgi:hypothetical protein